MFYVSNDTLKTIRSVTLTMVHGSTISSLIFSFNLNVIIIIPPTIIYISMVQIWSLDFTKQCIDHDIARNSWTTRKFKTLLVIFSARYSTENVIDEATPSLLSALRNRLTSLSSTGLDGGGGGGEKRERVYVWEIDRESFRFSWCIHTP
jgi:hypothetical protein